MKKGVILVNLGGPDSLKAIQPFLYNLFSDPYIIELPKLLQKPLALLISKLRAKKTRKYYEVMGGKSPQLEQTQRQAEALQRELGEGYSVKVGMRYWKPFIEDAFKALTEEGIRDIILLPLYPQYSITTTGSSVAQLEKVIKSSGLKGLKVRVIKDFHDYEPYIDAFVYKIKTSLREVDLESCHFLFSAHSLPQKVIERGDPYKEQTEETVRLIMEHFPDTPYTLAYQSKVGFAKWLEPSTDSAIRELAARGIKKLVVIPVSFVSEHSETLYELDVQYKELAESLGIESFIRVPTLQDEPEFIRALASLIREVDINQNTEVLRIGEY